MSSTIGEPFQLFLGSTLSQKIRRRDAVSCSYNRNFHGYATVTAQADGVHVWDLQNLHAVASYSTSKHFIYAAPAFTLHTTQEGNRSVANYVVLEHIPGIEKTERGRIVWIIRQSLSDSRVVASEKTVVVVDYPLIRICGTGHATAPLLLVSESASLFLANEQVDIKYQLDWPDKGKHLETFVFPRESCSFIQGDMGSCSGVAITCCKTNMILHVRLVLLGEDIVLLGTCEIRVPSSANIGNIRIIGLTCSPSGILSYIDSRGIWVTYQLASLNSSLVLTPVSENLHLRHFSFLTSEENGFSAVSLGTSIVLLAAVIKGTPELSLQIWDLSYGVLLTARSLFVPSASPSTRLRLTVADEGQVLLTVIPVKQKGVETERSSIHVVPVDPRLRSNLATALGKATLTADWLMPKVSNGQKLEGTEETAKIISEVQTSLQKKNAQQAENAFLKWVDSHSSKELALGHEFVKKIFGIILPLQPSTNYPHTPRIIRCLLENAVVSTIMLSGQLITALRQRGDWENVMFALTKVTDISEDELMASAKFLIDRRRRNENAMEVDTSEGYSPPLWSYLSACVSYQFSSSPMRLAIRKHLPDAQDLVLILEILENWVQGGTEHDMEALFKSMATNTEITCSGADSPPYPKVIMFLQALLDASFVALLQYQPSYDLLRRILSYIEPEITLIDRLEPLRGVLEPFVKAHMVGEETGASEGPAEWRKRKKQLEQRDSLNVGLYRLEELVI